MTVEAQPTPGLGRRSDVLLSVRDLAVRFALRGQRDESTGEFFNLPPADPAFAALRQLYDVAWRVTVPSRGRLSLEPLGATAGAAWFSASVARLPDLAALAVELRGAGERLHERAAEVLWLDGSDARVSAVAVVEADRQCREARVSQVDATTRGRVTARDDRAPAPRPSSSRGSAPGARAAGRHRRRIPAARGRP